MPPRIAFIRVPVILALALAGCEMPRKIISVTSKDGVFVTCELHRGSKHTITNNESIGLYVYTDDFILQIQGGKLRFNNRDYGAVRLGDRVKVDATGVVTVNNQVRTGT